MFHLCTVFLSLTAISQNCPHQNCPHQTCQITGRNKSIGTLVLLTDLRCRHSMHFSESQLRFLVGAWSYYMFACTVYESWEKSADPSLGSSKRPSQDYTLRQQSVRSCKMWALLTHIFIGSSVSVRESPGAPLTYLSVKQDLLGYNFHFTVQ